MTYDYELHICLKETQEKNPKIWKKICRKNKTWEEESDDEQAKKFITGILLTKHLMKW